jgi:hypothetical protein
MKKIGAHRCLYISKFSSDDPLTDAGCFTDKNLYK